MPKIHILGWRFFHSCTVSVKHWRTQKKITENWTSLYCCDNSNKATSISVIDAQVVMLVDFLVFGISKWHGRQSCQPVFSASVVYILSMSKKKRKLSAGGFIIFFRDYLFMLVEVKFMFSLKKKASKPQFQSSEKRNLAWFTNHRPQSFRRNDGDGGYWSRDRRCFSTVAGP